MIGWIARALLVLAGFITSLFVAREALNFEIIQMVVAVILFAIVIFIAAFWPQIKMLFKRFIK